MKTNDFLNVDWKKVGREAQLRRELGLKDRSAKESGETEGGGTGVYIPPPSEEEYERGPGGAYTPLLIPEVPISQGSLTAAYGFGQGHHAHLLQGDEYIAKNNELVNAWNAAKARRDNPALSKTERGQAADDVTKLSAQLDQFHAEQRQARAYVSLLPDGSYMKRHEKMAHMLTVGGVNYLQSNWNPYSPSESLALGVMTVSFLTVAANRSRFGIVTGDAFSDAINELDAAVQNALAAEAVMMANDTTTNKANFKYACAPIHGMLSKILRYLRALGERVTPNDYYMMGLPALGDNPHSPIPYPSEVMTLTITKTMLGRLYYEIRRPNGKKAKEYGVHGYEIRIIAVDKDTDIATFTFPPDSMSFFTTKSQGEVALGMAHRGQRYFVNVRAENTKGQKGPDSETHEFMLG